jgi:hypothetical protein
MRWEIRINEIYTCKCVFRGFSFSIPVFLLSDRGRLWWPDPAHESEASPGKQIPDDQHLQGANCDHADDVRVSELLHFSGISIPKYLLYCFLLSASLGPAWKCFPDEQTGMDYEKVSKPSSRPANATNSDDEYEFLWSEVLDDEFNFWIS